MNRSEFLAIVGAISSLEGSTYLRIQCGGIVCELNRRCSPYVSHGQVAFSEVEEEEPNVEVLSFENARRRLMISEQEITNAYKKARGGEEVISTQIPSRLLRNLLDAAEEMGVCPVGGIVGSLLWVVTFRPRLVGWDECGKPIFAQVSASTEDDQPTTEEEVPPSCPVCGGNTSTYPEDPDYCRSCGGTGQDWREEE